MCRDMSVQAASPGRIEFIGNHTDYNGGRVLGVSLDLGIRVAARRRADRQLHFSSGLEGTPFGGSLDRIEKQTGPLAWANYPLGILQVLLEAGHRLAGGLDLRFSSTLPVGAGLSSSAAIELCTLEAVCALFAIPLGRKEKVLLAQRAENRFVGMPCGILDQAVSCFGRRDHLVCINCATTEIEVVPAPSGLHFHVFNTNRKHRLVDSLYARRHEECGEALRRLREREPGLEHLAHADLSLLEFLGDHPVLQRRARHVIEEQARVGQCVAALEAGELARVGDLLFASHASSRDLFENSIPELDTFVELLARMRESGVIGARLSGGGFGGAVMALTTEAFGEDAAGRVLQAYGERHPESAQPGWLHVRTGPGTRLLD